MKRIINLLAFFVVLISTTFGQKAEVTDCVLCSEPGGIHNPNGELSSILGRQNLAEGYSAIAGGAFSRAKGIYSIALGASVVSEEDQCVSFGSNILNQSSSGMALGKFLVNTGEEAVIIGMGYDVQDPLINPIRHSIMFGMYSTAPTLFISEPLRPTGEKFLTGRIGVGNILDPDAKLHIKADQGEAASLFLQPNEIGSFDTVKIFLGNDHSRIESKLDHDLSFYSSHNYLFPSGYMGIGTNNPISLLDVNGGIHALDLESDNVSTENLTSTNIEADFFATSELSVVKNNETWAVTIENQHTEGKGLLVKAGTYSYTNPIIEVQDKDGNSVLYAMANQGKIGIGTNSPLSKLDVNGTIRMTGLKMPTNAINGFVLTTNSTGDAAWIDPTLAYYWQKNLSSDIYRMTKVGIKTQNPAFDLDVAGTMGVTDYIIGKSSSNFDAFMIIGSELGNTPLIEIGRGGTKKGIKLISPDPEGDIQMHINGSVAVTIESNLAKFGSPYYEMDMKVNGKINATEVLVMIDVWQDKVFDVDYALMDLNELESYISANRHLPGVPAESEVISSGINVGEMNALLMKKIEELTLYVIDLKKENMEMQSQLETLFNKAEK